MSFKNVRQMKAPTTRDKAQGDAHHVDSVRFNLAHAQAHLQEAASHARMLSGAMRNNPKFAVHIRALSKALSTTAGKV